MSKTHLHNILFMLLIYAILYLKKCVTVFCVNYEFLIVIMYSIHYDFFSKAAGTQNVTNVSRTGPKKQKPVMPSARYYIYNCVNK